MDGRQWRQKHRFSVQVRCSEARSTTTGGSIERTGVRVTVYACDVGNRDHLETVIQECTRDLPPIRGVIQGAMDLRVSQFESLCLSSFSID